MSKTLIIAKRELTSLFFSPIAYVVLGLFAIGAVLIFFISFAPGAPAEMRPTFSWIVWLMILLVPAISMRLLSEELRSGTIELMMTSPVNDTELVLGKWLGAMGFLLVLMLPPLVLCAVLETYGDPDYGPILSGLVGLLLVGGMYLAIGAFASALTQNQIIAFLVSVFVIGLFTIAATVLAEQPFLSPELREAVRFVNVNQQFREFNRGVFDTSNLVYFLSGAALFLFLAVKVLESKRWR